MTEYVEVLERLRVRSARKIVALIREQGQVVRVINKLSDLPDRDDAPFCECAETADADFIVTLNRTERSAASARAQAAAAPQAFRDPHEVATFRQLGLANVAARDGEHHSARRAPLPHDTTREHFIKYRQEPIDMGLILNWDQEQGCVGT